MTKNFLSLLPYLLLIQICSSKFDDIAVYLDQVYWDQDYVEGSLKETCATGKYSFVVINHIWMFQNSETHQLNLTGHCDPSSGCTTIGSEIKYCQQQGIKVMLSLEGSSVNYTLTSYDDAQEAFDYLWNNFLGGSSSSRPFGDAILDGIDFYISEATLYLDDLARNLKSHSTDTQKLYLSAAPQCCSPDDFLATTLATGVFDYVWVQFFENYSCEYSEVNTIQFFKAWQQWEISLYGSKSKLFLGLTASQGSGYVPVDLLISEVLPIVKESPNYGGVMLWTRTMIMVLKSAWVTCPVAVLIKVYESMNLSGHCCETICWNNCSCEAYATLNQVKIGCQIWLKGSKFIEDAWSTKGQSIYIVRNKVIKWWIWLIIGVGASLALPLICLCYASLNKYKVEVERNAKQKKILHEIGGNALISMVYGKAKRNKKLGREINEVEIFSFESIVAATNNFSDSYKLGVGGFGPVYKGTLADGQEVAIKRLSKNSRQGLTEFKNEAKLMVKLSILVL
ncbi:hypothetical protein K1719_018717 [Acacia pycnantha]|nr:hypothetical protein K1719_018717 [Acacia pycnantha]